MSKSTSVQCTHAQSTPADRGRRDGARKGSGQGHRYELIEMAVLFGTAAVADLLVDVLGHGSEGPGVLGCLSAMLVAVVIVHRVWNRHTTSPPRRGRARSKSVESADLVSPSEVDDPESAEVGALWRLRTSVEDTPGRLAVLAGALAAAGANILTLQVHPTGSGATDEFLVRTPPGTPADKLTAAVRAVGGGEPWVGRAEVQALADPTARALVLARQLLSDPGMGADTVSDSDSDSGAGGETEAGSRLLAVLAELLDASKAEWCAEGSMGAAEGADCDTLRLTVPGYGILQITRPGLPFTPAECARARAMAELATASARTEPSCGQS